MAHYTNLIAISVTNKKYEVVSEISTQVNVRLISEDLLFNDVSESTLYLDEAATIHKDTFIKYLYPEESNPIGYKWYKELPPDAKLIIVHKLEWESGLSD